jgi:hypothetical protein
MLAQQVRVEHDLPAVGVHSHAELYVLDRGPCVALLIEPAQLQEDVPPDGPETGPERRRGPRTRLVDVMVEEVPEIGHHAARVGIVVVRSEQRGEGCVGVE